MEEEQITPEEQSKRNKEFGRSIADAMWEAGMTKCPLVLNSEQADALHERWEELQNNQMDGRGIRETETRKTYRLNSHSKLWKGK